MDRPRTRVWDIYPENPQQDRMPSNYNNHTQDEQYSDEDTPEDIIRHNRYHHHQGDHYQNQHEGDQRYSNRVHSIHRNRYNSHNEVLTCHEARLGGTCARTLRKPLQEGLPDNYIENHADLIVAKMEQDPSLMEDSPISEDLRREALRDMPQCLTLKKCVKVKLQKSVSQKSKRKPIGCWKSFKYRMSFAVSRLKLALKNLQYSLELWYGALKQIEGNFGSGVGSFFKFLRCIFVLNLIITVISLVFIVLPQVLHDQQTGNRSVSEFAIKDVFTGEGYFKETLLYYGFYSNQTFYFGVSYSMPHAYFFTIACIYLGCLLFFTISAARSYRKSFIETEGGLKNVYANKIFCGWDYSIATKDAAHLKSQAIYSELRELLFESVRERMKRTCLDIFYTRIIQVVLHLLVIISLAAAGYLMWYLMKKSSEEKWSSIYTALVVNTIMLVFPILFSWIVKYEDHQSPKFNMYLTLIRTFVLGFVIVGVLLSFWLKNPNQDCWETSLGQEVYRLILFDFFISVIISPIIDLLIFCIYRYFHQSHLHFDISRNTMQIIYNQSLFWVGLIFSPLLSVIVTIKLFIMWYVRQVFLLKFCKPSSRSWRAAQASTWFMMIALVGLLLVGGLIGYVVTDIPTTSCGPFRDYNYIYEIVTIGVLDLKNHGTIFKVLLFATKPGVIALLLFAICARVYYMRAKAHALRGVVAIYREMLLWEFRDKEFLLQNISRITKGEWQYKLQDGRKLDPINSTPSVSHYIMDESGDNITRDPSSLALLQSIPSTSFTVRSSDSDLDQDFSRYKKFS